jgi:hypothetical protein
MLGAISPDEQRWLQHHTEECAECSRYGELSRRAIRALDSFAFEVDPAAALRVENAVRSHANRLASNESQARFLIGAMAAMLLTLAGSIVMWQPAAWLAGRWNLPSPAWQIGFAMFWLVPSIVLGMLPLFRTRLMGDGFAAKGETI